MRLNISKWVVPTVTLLIVSVASAQSDQAATNGQATEAGTGGVEPSPELTAQRDVQLTPEQMLKQAEGHLTRMDTAARSVRRQLTNARQERDVVKVLCLNDKLNQIDVALNSATDRQKTLESLVQSNNADRAKHEYTIISVLRERVETLLSEANQCVGEELGYVGETEVNVEIDPGIPDTDPSEFPDEPFVSEPPRLSSPTY